MKRVIRASNTATASMMEWLRSDDVSDMMKTMTPFERTIVGKIANNSDPTNYIGAIADAVDLLKPHISKSFDEFIRYAVEVFRA